ncbi:hypothetical protein BX600DRAFT_117435 [Xylariales sp. PMI_506]|nr:hypothetical protein BX600DRAFT_117435 [Xylariales sp. PMI_506]
MMTLSGIPSNWLTLSPRTSMTRIRTIPRDGDGYNCWTRLAPLLDIVRKTRDRKISPKVHIDVVRPGTVEELDEYLNINNKTPYDIVHFDLHGKIGPVNPALRSRAAIRAASKALAPGEQLQIERQSYLRFARPYDPDLLRFRRNDNPIDMLLTDDTSLNDVPVEHIARKLQDCRISKVALSACLSSYAQSRIFLNMCHTFLKHDVAHVSAMSFQTLESTARVYYSAFYESLILRGEAFHVAASEGRKALRANHQQYGYAVLPTDYHQPNRNLNLDTWRTTSEELKPPPVLTVYTARYGTLLCLLVVLCVAYAMAPLSLWLALLSVVVTAAVAVWLATGRWMAKLAPAAEQVRQQQREKSRRSNAPFEIDIEHMVIEDRLKSEANQGALYVWSTDYSKELSECVHDLAQIWVLTGFVDSADIIPAKVFSWAATSAPPWRWLRTRRYRSDRASTIGRRRLLVIKDFDGFYPRDPRPEDRESLRAALLRMVSFIEGYDREDTYLLITGSYDEEWWADGIRYDDERIVDKIVRAVPHNHNITPARKHIPRWSALGIKRRWSAFRNELL